MIRNRRIAALVAALAIVAAMAGGIVYAAGPGTFTVNLLGGGAQQGGVTITGACQAGDPVTVEFQNVYDEPTGTWAVEGLSIAGINAACTGGALVVNGLSGNTYTIAGADTGTGTVGFAAGEYPVGSIGSLDILLTE